MATSTLHAADRDVSRKADERRQSSSLAWEEAAVRLDLEQWIVDRLRHPVETSTSYLQLLRDSGSALCLPLLKVRHADRFSSAIGSLSFAADVQLRDCEAFAADRTWQAALLGLPCDGVSYSVVCDEDELSERETFRLLDLVARQLNRPQAAGSILFPGRGCRREFMGKLFGAMQSNRDVAVTGKPDCLGGLNLNDFAAEGIAAIVSPALLRKGQRIQGAKVAVEGFRALGQAISQRLARDGLRLVALSDNSGGIYRADGLILPDVNSQINREQVLFGYSQAERISRAEVLRREVDALILTAGSDEINPDNCGGIQAPIVIEADWNAVTPAAKPMLSARDTTVVPWVLSSAGMLIGAWFESHNANILAGKQELLTKIHTTLEKAFTEVCDYAEINNLSMDEAAIQIGLERAADCERACETHL
jgi:glutamate dehydrogenase (NAD(P)+)